MSDKCVILVFHYSPIIVVIIIFVVPFTSLYSVRALCVCFENYGLRCKLSSLTDSTLFPIYFSNLLTKENHQTGSLPCMPKLNSLSSFVHFQVIVQIIQNLIFESYFCVYHGFCCWYA